jgi:hypothetical protein
MSSGGATKVLIILADYTMVLIGLGILTAAFFWQWTLSGEMIALIGGTIGLFSKCIADFHGFESAVRAPASRKTSPSRA